MKGPGGEFDECCDAGCTRPIPSRDPVRLLRLGWHIDGPLPVAVHHPPHTPEQPYLTRGYTVWRYGAETRVICASCAEKQEAGDAHQPQ